MRSVQQLRHWQQATWRQVDFRLPARHGTLLLILLLAALATHLPWVAGLALSGFMLLAAWQGYRQPAAPLLVAAATVAPLFLLDTLLALVLRDARITGIWLAIALFTLLLCLAGAFVGARWQERRRGIGARPAAGRL